MIVFLNAERFLSPRSLKSYARAWTSPENWTRVNGVSMAPKNSLEKS